MKKNNLNKYNLIRLKKVSSISLDVIIKNIKYCKNIIMPDILIDKRKAVVKDKIKIIKKETSFFLCMSKKMFMLI